MTAETRPIKVFYSYSHKDKKLRAKLETYLSALKQEGVIQEWHDGCIQPGQEWEGLIYQQLAAADLVLLLISPDFIQSEFCYRREMKQALERHEADRACVIPIILRPTDWETSPFSKLQCLPEGGRPVTAWRPQDKAFLNIAKGIRQVVGGWRPKLTRVTPALVVPKPALRKAYLNLMVESWHTLPLDVLDASTADPAARRLTLDQVYVSLDTITRRPDKLKANKPGWEEDKPLSVVEALCHADRQRLVLLGQPGSGKSTFGRHLALMLAQSLRKKLRTPLGQQLPGWKGKVRLPVFIPLRQLAASLSPEQQGTVSHVTDFIRRQVDERAALAGFGEPLVQELQTQGGLVIFDGLDEVAADRRLAVKQALSDFAEVYEH